MDNNTIVDNADFSVEQIATTPKKKRGFAAMDPAKVKEISSMGGKRAHQIGTAHKWTKESATRAGKLGGIAPHKSRGRSVNNTKINNEITCTDKTKTGGLITEDKTVAA